MSSSNVELTASKPDRRVAVPIPPGRFVRCLCRLCCSCNKLARHWFPPKTHTWPSGHTRELPGSLPGPSRWGFFAVYAVYAVYAISSLDTGVPLRPHPKATIVGTYQGVAGLAPRPFTLGEETGSHLRPSPPSPPPSVAAVGRRRRPTPRPSASGPVASQLLPPTGVPRRDQRGTQDSTAETGVRSAVLHSPPPVLRACGGCQGACGSPGPAVVGGPTCCQRRRTSFRP